MENNINKLNFLMLIVGKKRLSRLSFESLVSPNILPNLTMMLTDLPILQDTYLCETTIAQEEVELDVKEVYENLVTIRLDENENVVADSPLEVHKHLSYIEKYLSKPLPGPFSVLDANHSWMVYWLLNAHVVLSGDPVSPELRKLASLTIRELILDNGVGGIAGGPNGQIGHVALTYAALLTLALIEDFDTMAEIKENLYGWLLSLKHSDGSFAMHLGGEHDTRSTYCVLVVASLLDMVTPELVENTGSWLMSCQTFEGGFAGVPNAEAHGGYTFCATASLFLLGEKLTQVNTNQLIRWLVARQFHLEGGFSGRTNKLVDACYSFWVGAALVLMECSTGQELFNRSALKTYILNCCQERSGGLRDKIGKSPDFYHTNYTLCGLSLTEYSYLAPKIDAYTIDAKECHGGSAYTLPVNPVFGLPLGTAEKCREHFASNDTK